MKNKNKKAKKPKEKKNKKKDKDALPFKVIVKNNVWAMSVLHKSAPGFVFYRMLMAVLFALVEFIIDTWLLRFILNSFDGGQVKLVFAVGAIAAAYAVSYLLNIVSAYIERFVMIKKISGIVRSIKKRIFRKTVEADLACYEDPDYYDKYVKAMDEASSRVFGVFDSVIEFERLILNLIFNGALLIIIDPFMLVFAVFPILFGLMRKKELQVYYKYVAEQKPIDRRKKYIRRTFYLADYAKEMRLTDMAPSQIEHFRELYGKYKKILRKHGVKRTILGFVGECSGDLISSVGSIIYAVYRTVVSGSMQVGDCAVTVNAIQQLDWMLNSAVTDLADFTEHALYIRDMREFLAYEPKIKRNENGRKARPGVIAFEHVSFAYTGAEHEALQDVSFKLYPDKRYALVGRNGAGKSTIVKLLLRLYKPTEGKITLDGIDLSEYDLSSYRQMFCTMFQDFKLFSMTVAENVARRPLEEGDAARVLDALDLAGVGEKIKELDHQENTVLLKEFDKDGAVLSGGESQKVRLASVFFAKAPYAVLDEPSSALDPIAEYKVFEGMINATEGKCVLFISHRLSSAVLADEILVMEKGRLVEEGNHERLLEAGGVYASMFHRQAENYFDEDEEGGEAV